MIYLRNNTRGEYKMKKSHIIGLVIILSVFLIWGLIGSAEVSEIGNTCDIGINDKGSMFCWKWHQNIIGDIGDAIDSGFNK